MGYIKFTLATFKKRLTGGSYENLTGANRAIGKTQELSEEDKGKARAMAAKYFGVALPAKKAATKAAAKPAKKVDKTVTKKAAAKGKPAAPPAKKVAKKAVKKSAKKVAKRATKAIPDTEPAPGASPKAPAMAAPKAPASIVMTTELPEARKLRVIEQMGSVITTIGQALTSMKDAKQLFPKAELEEGVNAAVFSMSRAVQRIDQEVISPDLHAAPVVKPVPKTGKRTKTETAAPEADTVVDITAVSCNS